MKLKRFAAAAMSAAMMSSVILPVSAAEFGFEDLGSIKLSGLNNQNFSVREISADKAYTGKNAYRCSGEGEIGFRMPEAIPADIAEDDNAIYALTVYVYTENTTTLKLSVTTPGGFESKSKEISAAGGEWEQVEMEFVPVAGSAFNTLSFSAPNGGTFYVDDVEISRRSERYSLFKQLNFNTEHYNVKWDNGGIQEDGVRIAYSSGAKTAPLVWNDTKDQAFNSYINNGATNWLRLNGQLPQWTEADIGKTCKIEASCLAWFNGYQEEHKIKTAVGICKASSGQDWVGADFYEAYGETEVPVRGEQRKSYAQKISFSFEITEQLLGVRDIMFSATSDLQLSSTLNWTLDDVNIYVEN